MAIHYNPKLVTKNLILCLDAANVKSYNSAENLFTNSNDFSTSSWTYQQNSNTLAATASTTGTLDPFGGNSATKLYIANAGTFYSANRGITVTANVMYSYSLYLKAAEVTTVTMTVFSGTNNNTISINLSTGVVTGNSIIDITLNSSTTTAIGNGWYRQEFNFYSTSGGSFQFKIDLSNNTSVNNGIYIYGAQIEKNRIATNYTATGSSTISRTTTWTDLTNTANFTLQNTVPGYYFYGTTNQGYIGFDGSQGSSSVDTSPARTNFGASSFTFSAFAYFNSFTSIDSATYCRLCEKTGYPNSYFLVQVNSTGTVNFQGYDDTAVTPKSFSATTTRTLSTSTWYMITAVLDRTTNTFKVYINDNLEFSNSLPSGFANITAAGDFRIPSGFGEANFRVGCVHMYNTALTLEQIDQNFNALRGRYGI